MNGPRRWRDDPNFEATTGIHIADEAATLSGHNLQRLRKRVLTRAASGARPRVDPTAQPGTLNALLTALGLLVTAGAIGLAAVDPAPDAPRAASTTPAPLNLREPGFPKVTIEPTDAGDVGFCPAGPLDLAPQAATVRATWRAPRRRTSASRPLFPRLSHTSLGNVPPLTLTLSALTDSATPGTRTLLALEKDLLPALLRTARFKVFK